MWRPNAGKSIIARHVSSAASTSSVSRHSVRSCARSSTTARSLSWPSATSSSPIARVSPTTPLTGSRPPSTHGPAKNDDVEVRGDHARFVVRPSRGGMLVSFDVDNTRVLYMDDGTLEDTTKNVRGGVPILFPSPGKLQGDAWSYAGKHGSMKQHGFARN